MPASYFLVGGAGFIGSHFTDRLLADPAIRQVTLYDNFSSGREWHFQEHRSDPRLSVVRGDVSDLDTLCAAMAGHEVVIHLASNPDIARAAREPDIDFREGTLLTNNVLEAIRRTKTGALLYASGSGVYGDLGTLEAEENHTPMTPVSTYGASKLSGEAMIWAYSYMFNLRACMFRFGNVVGPRQTHGVGFDFIRSLRADPTRLRILGDGSQSKSYIHVHDVVDAVLLAHKVQTTPCNVYNVATGDYITVKDIADLAAEVIGLDPAAVSYEFTGGDRGWKGDVPIVRLSCERIKGLGWAGALPTREALRRSMSALLEQADAGLF